MKNLSTDSIQFGEGNFLRAFVDYCIQLLNEETEFKGKVNVVQPIEKGTISDLKKQNGQYHVFLEGIIEGKQLRSKHLINCLDKLINPFEDFKSSVFFLSFSDIVICLSFLTSETKSI